MYRPIFSTMTIGCLLVGWATGISSAQTDAIDADLKRLNGHWRMIEMVEDGNAIPEAQMREHLPGGGRLEIIDYTILFRSPIDGTKSTKSFRLNPSVFPKRMAIMDRDTTTGVGIYKFDQGKLVICLSRDASDSPTEFGASPGSKRMLMVLASYDPGQSELPGLNATLPKRIPVQVATKPALVAPPAIATPQIQAAPLPSPPIVAANVAARVLSDGEVRAMAVGKWRINDSEGSIDLVFNPNGIFQTYRYRRAIASFQLIFVPTPVSTGTWSIAHGRLIANVTSSTRFDRLNQSFAPAVRSISATDMILVDHLGRVSRAIKIP